MFHVHDLSQSASGETAYIKIHNKTRQHEA